MQINMLIAEYENKYVKTMQNVWNSKIIFWYAEFVTNKMQNMLYMQNMQNNITKYATNMQINMLSM